MEIKIIHCQKCSTILKAESDMSGELWLKCPHWTGVDDRMIVELHSLMRYDPEAKELW